MNPAQIAVSDYYSEHPPRRRYIIEQKTHPVLLRTKGILIHGIDIPRWQQILDTGIDDLFIWELRRAKNTPVTPLLLYQAVAVLDQSWDNTVPPCAVYPEGMRQWKRESFVGGSGVRAARICVTRGCTEPVPSGRSERLCDRHYEAVSDTVIARHIARLQSPPGWS